MLAKVLFLESEKNQLSSQLTSVKNDNENLFKIQKENDEKVSNISKEKQSYIENINIMVIEIDDLKKSLTQLNDKEFESNYISEELFVKSLNDNKDEFSLILNKKEQELLETLNNLGQQTRKIEDLLIYVEELEKNSETIITKSNIIESEKPVFLKVNESNKNLKPHGVNKRSCPFPSCNGKGNIRSGFNTHTTIINCPMAKHQNPQKLLDNNESQEHLPKDGNKLFQKLKSYRVIKSNNTPLRQGCLVPSCYGKGNIKSNFKTHSTIRNCPIANLQKPHSIDELKDSVIANNLLLSKDKILLEKEVQSLQEKLINFEVMSI